MSPKPRTPSKSKQYLSQNVFEAAVERTEKIFREFEKVYFSFSGGKDSSVMLHIAFQVARKLDRLPLHVLFVDLEGNYKSTVKHLEEMMIHPDVVPYWVCLPLNLRNAVSQYQSQWMCWDPKVSDKWIREIPSYEGVISDPTYFPFFKAGMEFEEFVVDFGEWFSEGHSTACVIAIRSDESLNRFRTIVNKKKIRYKDQWSWSTKISDHVYNTYPIYDWKTSDVWAAVGKNHWSYNHLYDLMYLQGRSLHQQRICQPYGDDQKQGLDLFHECEPETWVKVVQRVHGANMGSLYRGNPLLGNIKVNLPEHIGSWKEYVVLLLASMPRYEAAHYISKIRVFLGWWEFKGGVPLNEVPDCADPKLEARKKVPSWKRIAKVLIKNDRLCKALSFNQTKNQRVQWNDYFTRYQEDYRSYEINN